MDRFFTPPRLIMAVFFIQGALLANWFPRIPDVQANLALGPAQLSLGLIGMPIGSFIALSLAGRLTEWLTPRGAMMLGGAIYCAGMSLPGWAWDIPSLFLGLMLLGASYVTIDVAMNVEAAAIQEQVGRRIMSTCHGFWSLGSMVGAVMGGGFAEIAIGAQWHLLVVGLVALPGVVGFARALPALAAPQPSSGRRPIFSLPALAMIGLCMFAFGVVLAELATRTWAAVFLRDVLGASPAATGIGYGAFSLFMAAGRFLGDQAADRFGLVTVARLCGAAAVLGTVVIVAADSTAVAIVGLAGLGLGISVGYPLAVSAAARRGDRPAPINVAALALFAFSSSLIGPPLVGFVAEIGGLRVGLATILPFVIASTLLAGQLNRRSPGGAPVPAGEQKD